MKFVRFIFLVLVIIAAGTAEKNSSKIYNPVTEKFQIVITEKPEELNPQNKTIDKLVQEQTDLIKKIISSHKATADEYPVVTKKEVQVKNNSNIKEKERQSIEELQKKCQELIKLSTPQWIETSKNLERTASTVQSFTSLNKPEFLKKPQLTQIQKPLVNYSKTNEGEQATKTFVNYFILSRNRTEPTTAYHGLNLYETTTETSSDMKIPLHEMGPESQSLVSPIQTVQYPVHSNIKYVQLEPIILQKLILNNGRILFYWYRSLPTVPQYTPIKQQQPVVQLYPSTNPSIEGQNLHGNTEQIPKTSINMKHEIKKQQPEKIVPNYEVEYGTTERNDNNLYTKRMKFVIPLPYPVNSQEETHIPTRLPWQFDPYAYFPKPLQPTMINMPVPYTPTFHMIRTLTIPDKMVNEGISSKQYKNM